MSSSDTWLLKESDWRLGWCHPRGTRGSPPQKGFEGKVCADERKKTDESGTVRYSMREVVGVFPTVSVLELAIQQLEIGSWRSQGWIARQFPCWVSIQIGQAMVTRCTARPK